MKMTTSKQLLITTIMLVASQVSYCQLMGKSLDFSSNGNSYVQLSGDSDFGKVSNFQENFTFEAWVNAENSGTWSRVFDFGDSTNDYIFFTTKSGVDGKPLFEYRHGGGVKYRLHASEVFPSGWVHVAITFAANGDVKLYFDGVEVSAGSWATKINYIYGTTKNYLGKSQFVQDPNFAGKLDEVRVWKEVRSAAQIIQWKDCELSGNEDKLIAYFKMNQGLSTGPNTQDNFVDNYGKLSKGRAFLYNFALVGNNGNWVNDTPIPTPTSSTNSVEMASDGFNLPNEHLFDFDDAYTFETWVYPNVNDGARIITIKANSSLTDYPFYVEYQGNHIFHGQRGPSFHNWAVAYNALELGKWQHLSVVTYEINGGVKNEIYINGILKGEKFHPNQQLTQNDAIVTLGHGPGIASTSGRLSNTRYWNKRLQTSQIIKNMSSNYPPNTEGLVAQYNTFSNIELGLVDNAGTSNHAGFVRTPSFSYDPCYVRFTSEPQDAILSITGGENITFEASVENCSATTYIYQWQHDGVDIPGANNESYTINNASGSDLGEYTLNVTACDHTYTSKAARLSGQNEGTQLHFDGIDDYIEFDDTYQPGVTAYTIETWVRFDETPVNQNIIVLTNDQGPESYYTHQIRVNPEGYAEHSTFDNLDGPNTKTVSHPHKILPHVWYHLRATAVEGGVMSISVNGDTSPHTLPLGEIALGSTYLVGHPACDHGSFKGEMDELRIWTIDTDTYNDPELIVEPADLQHYFHFNKGIARADNSGLTTTLIDPFSVPENTAILHNFDFVGEESNWTNCGPFESNELSNALSDQTKFVGEEIVLVVNPATVTSDESYQWYKDGQVISGANSNELRLTNLQPADNGAYHVIMDRPDACSAVSNVSNVLVYGSGEVLNFDGEDDYITIQAINPDVNTISMWVKFEGDVTLRNIMQGTDQAGTMSSVTNQIFTDADGYLCYYSSPTGDLNGHFHRSIFQVNSDQWYHISIVQEVQTGEFEFYVDGVVNFPNAIPSPAVAKWSGMTEYRIGSRGITVIDGVNTILNPFQGEVDELRIFHRRLYNDEVVATRDFEWYSDEAAACGCQNGDPITYLKFNQGLADADNSSPMIDQVPNFSSEFDFDLTSIQMHNFTLQGITSNWSDCSPIKIPSVALTIDNVEPIAGEELRFQLQTNTDTSLLSYQWRKDSINIDQANFAHYLIENYASQDTAFYDVIVSDFCDPQFVDTIGVESPSLVCIDHLGTIDIDYPAQTIYTGCTQSSDPLCGIDGLQIDQGYCNTDNIYLGKEAIYRLTLAESKVVSLDLTAFDSDLDLFFINGSECNIDDCLASSIHEGLPDEHITVEAPAGVHYIIIETKDHLAGASTFTLEIELFDGKCYDAELITCGSEISGNTANGSMFMNEICGNGGYTGRESIYEIVVDRSSTLHATLSDMSVDLDLILLDSLCQDTHCVAISNNELGISEEIIKGIAPGTYYLVVDGVDGVEGDFTLNVECNDYFEASYEDNDAYIDLDWSIDKNLCVPQDTGVIVRILTSPPSQILYEEEYTTAELTPDIITGTYRHYVGTDHTRSYKLRVYNRLSNKILCDELKVGKTLPFQQPEIISTSTAAYPDSIRITWRNHSALSDQLIIYRDGEAITTLSDGYTEDSLIVSFVDSHDINDSGSIQQNAIYEYSIETYSSQLLQSYPAVNTTGSTYDIGFEASDLTSSNRIHLSWNDISAHCTSIKVERNGMQLMILSPQDTSYEDLNPIYGVNTEYSLTLLDGPNEIMEVYDQGEVAAHGKISGLISTLQGDFPIEGATIILSKDTIIAGNSETITIQTTTSDFMGNYVFEDIVYGLEQEFEVSINKTGSSFLPIERIVTLNQAEFDLTDIDFQDQLPVTVSEVSNLVDDFTATAMDDADIVSLDWAYTYNPTDTLFFNLYRNGNLIYSITDHEGAIIHFDDYGGAPDSSYIYTLQITKNDSGQKLIQEIEKTVIYPSVTPLSGWDYETGDPNIANASLDPRIFFDWSAYVHPSQNFEGFRIYRNGVAVAETDHLTVDHSYLTIPGSTAGYEIVVFRVVNGIVYESAPFPTQPVDITANNIFEPVFSISGRIISFSLEDVTFDPDFWLEPVYDGVIIERKLQSESDTEYRQIGEFSRQYLISQSLIGDGNSILYYFDTYSIGGTEYDYRLSSHINVNGVSYTAGYTQSHTAPPITGPTDLTAVEEEGKVGLNWTSQHTGTIGANTQLYINYEGYEVTRTPTGSGLVPEIIATLPANTEGYNDFISNPVYDIFFDEYTDQDYDYEVKAYVDVEGVRHYADPISVVAGPIAGSTDQPLPFNFMASRDLPGQIKLCWDWDAALQSDFIIYRGEELLTILPYTARAFYDYDAPEGVDVPYTIQSRFEGEFSQEIRAEGYIPTLITISGRVTNVHTGEGLADVNMSYFSGFYPPYNTFDFEDAVVTDATGNYTFFNVPNIPGLPIHIKANRINADFNPDPDINFNQATESITLSSAAEYIVDFTDYSIREENSSLANIIAVVARPNSTKMHVKIDWSVDNDNYDGFKIYRGDKILGDVYASGVFSFIDSTGFPGINFPYGVQAYRGPANEREFSEIVSTEAIFPRVEPVINLTATPFAAMNVMKIAWSHPLDNHDVYTISRNGQFMAAIPAGDPMVWTDDTGIPGVIYQYEVIAVKGDFVSDPVAISARYKGVGEVTQLVSSIDTISTQACAGVNTSGNHVALYWRYHEGAAQGFEIYRDGALIADIDSVTLRYGNPPLAVGDTMVVDDLARYEDYTGIPGMTHEYHVLAYVIREGERYTSGKEELYLKVNQEFPEIAQVSNLSIGQNNILGSVQITFDYHPYIVQGFEILRNGVILDTIFEAQLGSYIYQDFDGVPGQEYDYGVRVFDTIAGNTYYSGSGCDKTVTFPIVPVPQMLTATQGTFENHIEVKWSFATQAYVDSFHLENITLDQNVSFSSGSRKYIDLVNDNTFSNYEYRIRASRATDGVVIYSAWSDIIEGWAAKQVTGNEIEIINGSCLSNLEGFSTALDGEWGISGAINGQEAVHVYRQINGGWSLYQVLPSLSSEPDADFGFSVAISGDHLIVGSPKEDRSYIYTFDGSHWTHPQLIVGAANSRFGHAVDIDQDQCIISAPSKNFGSYSGEIAIYDLVNGLWTQSFTHSNTNTHRFGYGVAIEGDLASITYHEIGINLEKVCNFLKGDANWGLHPTAAFDPLTAYTSFTDLITDNIDLSDGKLLIGDQAFNTFTGRILTLDLTENSIGNLETYTPVGLGTYSYFGKSLAVKKIPSPVDDATYYMVGAPYYDAADADIGRAYLLSDISGSIQEISVFDYDNGDEPIEVTPNFGYSVALSENALLISAPLEGVQSRGNVNFHNLLKAPTTVNATDDVSANLDPTRVTITWSFDGNQDLLSGFNIYRNDEFLIFRDRVTTTDIGGGILQGEWEDNTGGAGQPYVYSVKSVNNAIPFESYSTSDEGYRRADGKIQGTVTVAGNNVAVPGVTITATGVVDGEVYTYTGTTFVNGEYILPNVYYDNDPAIATEYIVEASYLDHTIVAVPSNIATLNSLIDPTLGSVDFIDQSAYVIRGNVSQPLSACPLENVKVTPIINGVEDIIGQSSTDENGNYSVVINPNDPTLNELRIRIDHALAVGMDSIYFGFSPDADTVFTDFIDFPFITDLNYVDTLTYPIAIKVKNTCDDPISTARWNIRIRTLDGCYDQIYQTNSSGNLTVDLLPLDYTMTVVGANVQNATNQLATDYFANFPVKLNLKQLHIDSFATQTMEQIADASTVSFTYHVAPDIAVSGFSDYLCTTQTAILQQGESYTLNIDITEPFNGNDCAVSEGKIKINNPAAKGSGSATLIYDPLLEEFPLYTFIAGDPNQISPHFYTLTIDYLSDDDIFLGRQQQLVFVEGSVALPGSGILVDPVDGNDAVPLPLMVLRDPPGDGSSSSISGGQSITYETEITKELGGETNLSLNTELELFGQNTEFGFTNTLGGSDEQTNTYTNTLTLSQTISTFDPIDIEDETLTGVNADVIVGQGIVMSYGITNTYSVTDCDTISINQEYTISPDAASTTFHYTVRQIKDIITGFKNDSIKIYNGTKTLTERGEPLNREQSLKKISSYIDNWRQILKFHGRETIPMYNLCTTIPPINNDAEPGDDPIGNINLWKSVVCQELGTGLNETFELSDDIVWDDALMDTYNAAVVSIRNIARGTNEGNIWHYNNNIQGILAQAESLNEFGAFGRPVENITVGGGIAIERSIQNISASTRSNTSNFYVGNEISAAVGSDNEVTIVGGGFAGTGVGVFVGGFTGVIETSSAIKVKAGISGKFEFKKSNQGSKALENQVETSYTLSDDDSADAFSVTVIQGISQSQTPYFEFFGGFTSCPAEEGAIFVDKPALAIVQGNGTTDNILLQNVDPDEAAFLLLRAENQTPIASEPTRDLTISLDQSTNTSGAIVTLNGVSLNNGNLDLSLDAFDPIDLSLTIERGPLFYEYDNLKINIEPTCGGGPVETVEVSVRFTSPCSPVTLVQPDHGWLINDNVTRLTVAMQDYDPYNPVLENAVLEYRKLGTGDPFDIVNSLQLLKYNEVPADSLAAYNEALDATILNPKYFFNWAIPEDFTDGQYEVRIRMKCDFSNTYSNTVIGTLARTEMGLFGSPQPSDQVWTDGDEISFAFNLPVDCSIVQGQENFIDDNISIIDDDTGLPVGYTVSCFNNKLQFVLDAPAVYDGKYLTLRVDQIPSSTGNISAPHEWTFRVITQKVYWANGDTIHLRMYEDEMTLAYADLINTDGVPIGDILSLMADDGSMDSWLQVADPATQPFDLSPEGRQVTFEINSAIGIGSYIETINVAGVEAFGNTPQLHIQLDVLTRPPHWVVDPGAYSENMAVVANWKFDTESLDMISTDSIDLISVWIGSEIRGVANIEVNDGFAYAYITVYGSPADSDDSVLEFRIWDADPGTEYDGHLTAMDTIFFVADTQQGTVGSPRILNVNVIDDIARYIPLRGGQWTGFSLFTETANMSVSHKLRSLDALTEGDIILTGDKFAQYNDSIGWYSFGDQALLDLSTSEGYMIYLQDGPDTLRVSGGIALAEDIDLRHGWNWIGYPFEYSENINLAFDYIGANGQDKIKLDTPLPDEGSQTAQYMPANQSWVGNMPTMEPNNLYKLYVSNPNPDMLTWASANGVDEDPPTSSSMVIVADPDDASTWSLPSFNSDAVMPIIAQVLSGGIYASDPSDMVAIFEADTLRALASPVYLPEFDTHQFSLLVEKGEGNYDIRYYDAASDLVLSSTNILSYTQSGEGTFDIPYEILFDDGSCPNQLILGPSTGLFDSSATFEAGQVIRVRGAHSIPSGVEIIFDAPIVIFEGSVSPSIGSTVIVKPDGCE